MKTKFKSNLKKYGQAAPGIARLALQDTAKDIVDITKQLVPVDTGDLRNSYMYEQVDEDTIRVGSSKNRGVYKRGYPTYYAPYVEFGSDQEGGEAQPHFVPAFSRAASIFIARFKQRFVKG